VSNGVIRIESLPVTKDELFDDYEDANPQSLVVRIRSLVGSKRKGPDRDACQKTFADYITNGTICLSESGKLMQDQRYEDTFDKVGIGLDVLRN
jgi:hypothetical protein